MVAVVDGDEVEDDDFADLAVGIPLLLLAAPFVGNVDTLETELLTTGVILKDDDALPEFVAAATAATTAAADDESQAVAVLL